ncbi:hypothetical protein BGZ76_009364 [Entomortierella beljakovae]|nr:hypothetical protein BGZ76_009364 [Entomortierella beljakovae]
MFAATRTIASRSIRRITTSAKALDVTVPEVSEAVATKAQAKPSLPKAYFVERTKSGQLPVYSEYKNAGSRHLTIIRKIQGNAGALRKDILSTYPGAEVRLNDRNNQVILKGLVMDDSLVSHKPVKTYGAAIATKAWESERVSIWAFDIKFEFTGRDTTQLAANDFKSIGSFQVISTNAFWIKRAAVAHVGVISMKAAVNRLPMIQAFYEKHFKSEAYCGPLVAIVDDSNHELRPSDSQLYHNREGYDWELGDTSDNLTVRVYKSTCKYKSI